MQLDDFNIEQHLSSYIKSYLKEGTCTFSHLKNILLTRSSIDSVHLKMSDELQKLRDLDLAQAIANIKKSIIDQQRQADKEQEKRETFEAQNDIQQQNRLQTDLIFSTAAIESKNQSLRAIETQIALQNAQNSHQYAHPSTQQQSSYNTNEHAHPSTQQQNGTHTHEHGHPSAQHNHSNYQSALDSSVLRIQANALRQEIGRLRTHISLISAQLRQIDDKVSTRKQNELGRNARAKAYIEYLEGNRSAETEQLMLTQNNRDHLQKNINNKKEEIRQKCDRMISRASELNHHYFAQELVGQLSELSSLTEAEKSSLKKVIKLLDLYKERRANADKIASQLSTATYTLVEQESELTKLQNRVTTLKQQPDHVSQSNQKLTEHNGELRTAIQESQKNYNQRIRVGTFSTGLTIVLCLPLVLTLAGLLSPAAPLVALGVMIALPTIAAVVSLGFWISAAIASNTIKGHEKTIEYNSLTIEFNNDQLVSGNQELLSLESTLIPQCAKAISELTNTKNTLVKSLEEARQLADQTLEMAKKATPEEVELNQVNRNSRFFQTPSANDDKSVMDFGLVSQLT